MTSTRISRLVCIRAGLVCITLVLIADCATVRPVPVTLPLPPRPVLTPIKGDALQCLAPDVYSTLVLRERALRTWGLSLEAEIKALNAKGGK